MLDIIYNWVDLIWAPAMFYGVHKQHRWYALAFVLASIILTHTLSEIMSSIGYEYGIIGYIKARVHTRLLIVSSFFYSLFLFLAHISPGARGVIFFASSLSVFFMIFLFGSIVMIL